jgi:hypothetical protein
MGKERGNIQRTRLLERVFGKVQPALPSRLMSRQMSAISMTVSLVCTLRSKYLVWLAAVGRSQGKADRGTC